MNIHQKFFSKIGFNYLALGISIVVFQIIIMNILNVINPQYLNDYNLMSIISTICNYFLPFPIFYWLMKKIESSKLEKTGINVKTFILYIGITLTLMWIGNLIGLAITSILSSAMQNEITNPVQQLINSSDIWFNVTIISIIGPIIEEILFRKFLIDRTIKYGAKAYVYIRTGNIIYPIILHCIVNVMGAVVSLLIVSSVNNIQTGLNLIDAGIIIIYIIFLFSMLIIGLYGLTKFKKAKFNGTKTKIPLEYPYTTMFINLGMICFIAFYIFEMVFQALG